MAFTSRFVLELEHGTAVGLELPAHETASVELLQRVALEERPLADGFALRRLVTFVGGRLAAHEALRAVSAPVVPVLRDDRGAPIGPKGFELSISHKDDVAVALVAPSRDGWKIGVDVEGVAAAKNDISRHVTTAREREVLAACSGEERAWQLMARFSLKEALYKALDPFVHRFVGFDEVDLDLLPQGTTRVTLDLKGSEGPFEVQLRWLRREGLVLSTARVRRA
jgi:4'-phosphopantetheinyl transferase EntD